VERVTFDNSVYQVAVQINDDGAGSLYADDPVITKSGSEQILDKVLFENVYTPKPADLELDLTVKKTVKNTGSASIGPEDFRFVLENTATEEKTTLETDSDGLAVFSLTFTEEDIDKVYTYRLTEINDGKANVTYSAAKYDITITITLSEDNKLVAEIISNDTEVESFVGEFENTYDYTPVKPPIIPTGDSSRIFLWLALMVVSIGAIITVSVLSKKKQPSGN